MYTHTSFRGPLMKSLALLVLTMVAVPAVGLACQNCEFALLSSNRYCMDVVAEETGVTICTAIFSIWGIPVDCSESGTFCSNVNAGGGGEGGSGGSSSGGGSGCGGTGFCSAACFSCPGPGRPAV